MKSCSPLFSVRFLTAATALTVTSNYTLQLRHHSFTPNPNPFQVRVHERLLMIICLPEMLTVVKIGLDMKKLL